MLQIYLQIHYTLIQYSMSWLSIQMSHRIMSLAEMITNLQRKYKQVHINMRSERMSQRLLPKSKLNIQNEDSSYLYLIELKF